jgi:hypothetical protein
LEFISAFNTKKENITTTQMEEKIKEVQAYRDAQAKQLEEDTKGMSSLERVQGALQLHHIDGILKGLDIALRILKK